MVDTISATERDERAGTFHYGIAREQGGFRIMLRTPTSEWESAMMGGLHPTMSEAAGKLARTLAVSRYPVEIHTADVQAAYEAAVTEQARRKAASEAAYKADQERYQLEAERRAALEAEYATAKFHKATVKLAMRKDLDPQTVNGWAIGGLIVHKRPEGGQRPYRVSHIVSGMALGLDYATQREARMAAWRLSRVADWSQDGKAITRDKGLGAKVAALRMDALAEF
jgi:hypothetical protein